MVRKSKISYYAVLFLGVIFVFSALTKSLDFFAVSSKIQDYTRIFGLEVPDIYYGVGSIILVGTELLLGMLLIQGIFNSYVFYCTVIILTFFTILTFYTGITDGFEDCGCFGSVLSTNSWVSFVKNLILVSITIIAYPQSLCKSSFKYGYLFLSVSLVLLLCGFSIFSQPIIDSSKFRKGDKFLIDEYTKKSIDIEFYTDTIVDDYSRLVICRRLNEKSASEILYCLTDKESTPVILTSTIPQEINPQIFKHAIVGFMDNAVLNRIISSELGIILLDDEFMITNKWQKDYLNIQSYNRDNESGYISYRVIYLIIWILNLIFSIFYLYISIVRGCRKTHKE